LEEAKDDLEPEEYEETKADTLKELEAFEASLKEMAAGKQDLVDDFSRMQLAIRATIKKAFKTPAVIKMFAQKHPSKLRNRLSNLERDYALKKIDKAFFEESAAEILVALKKLNEKLTPAEEAILSSDAKLKSMFKNADITLGTSSAASIMNAASQEISSAETSAKDPDISPDHPSAR